MSSAKRLLKLVEDTPPPCTTVPDKNIFFPPQTQNEMNLREIEVAKSVCRRCKIVTECLEFALESEDKWAVMGATSPAERTVIAMRREQRRQGWQTGRQAA